MSSSKLILAAALAVAAPVLALAQNNPPAPAPTAAPAAAAPAAPAAGRGAARFPVPRAPSMALALEAAQAAIADCATRNYIVGALVTDVGGAVKVWLRSDGVRFNDSLTLPPRKIYTMRMLRMTGAQIEAANVSDPVIAARIAADPNATAASGALEIKVGAETIGYIAVSGAPGGPLDEACAKAGLDRIQSRLQ